MTTDTLRSLIELSQGFGGLAGPGCLSLHAGEESGQNDAGVQGTDDRLPGSFCLCCSFGTWIGVMVSAVDHLRHQDHDHQHNQDLDH